MLAAEDREMVASIRPGSELALPGVSPRAITAENLRAAHASSSAHTDLSVVTAEGDRVSLRSLASSESGVRHFDRYEQTADGVRRVETRAATESQQHRLAVGRGAMVRIAQVSQCVGNLSAAVRKDRSASGRRTADSGSTISAIHAFRNDQGTGVAS